MNTIEMNRAFLLKAHTLDVTELKDTSSYDVMLFLNEAQDSIIQELYGKRDYESLRPITTSTSIASGSFDTSYITGISKTKVIDLNGLTGYFLFLRSQSQMTRSAAPVVGSATWVNNEPATYETLSFSESNGINRPIFKNPKEYIEGDYLVVLPDYYTTISYIAVTYVRHPDQMTLDSPGAGETNTCELPVHLHQKIVDRAVEISMQTIPTNKDKKNQ